MFFVKLYLFLKLKKLDNRQIETIHGVDIAATSVSKSSIITEKSGIALAGKKCLLFGTGGYVKNFLHLKVFGFDS